jgi:triacylglycerol lipase
MLSRSWPWGAAASSRVAGRDTAVVLVHGYFCLSRAFYWQGLLPLRRELLAAGRPVVRSCQPRTGPVAFRAAQLARFLDRLPYPRLILVGHSMGGLDARFVASRLDPQRRIRHVVTIGTPHRGTAVADWALRDSVWLTRLVRFIDRGALPDLTLEHAERLNALMPDRDDVGYVSLAGASPPRELVGTLRRLGERLSQDEGANDGLVSLRSALRGPTAVSMSANHMELIGHWLLNGAGRSDRGRQARPVAALRAILARILGPVGPALPRSSG